MKVDPDDKNESPQIKTFRKWLKDHGYQPCGDVSSNLIPTSGAPSVLDDFLLDHPLLGKYRDELEKWESDQGFFTDILSDDQP